MAESIEATGSSADADLEIDRGGFRKAQFDVFKHHFLESFDEAGYEKLEHLTLDPSLKKEVVNMARRLQRAKISLNKLNSEDSAIIEPVISKIDEVFRQLIELSKQSSEYSVRNIKLPEFNRDDMETLLGVGVEQTSTNETEEANDNDPVKWLCKSNEEFERKIKEVLGAGELMMNEWHEIRNYVKINAPNLE